MSGIQKDALPRPSKSEHSRLDSGTLIVIGLCSLVYFLDGVVPALLGPLAPRISDELSMSSKDIGAVFSADLIGQSVGLLVIPLLGRWLTHRDTMWMAIFGFGFFQALSGFIIEFEHLFAARLLTGLCVGGALPAGLALVAGTASAERKGSALMLIFTFFGIGKAVAGVIVTLVGAEEWRQIFIVSGLLCVLAAPVVRKGLRIEKERLVSTSPSPMLRRIPASTRGPLLTGTALIWLLFICSLTINYCLASWLPTLLTNTGRAEQVATFAYSMFAIGGIIATFCFGPLIDRFGTYRVLTVSYLVGAMLLFTLGLTLRTMSDEGMLALLTMAGFFLLGSYGGINIVLADFYSADLRAIGAGWAKGVGRAGTVIAPILIGLALDAGVRPTQVISIFALPALVCVAVLGVIFRLRHRQP